MAPPPRVLARGPWGEGQVQACWRREPFQAPAGCDGAADAAIAELRARGSPSHDGLAARLAGFHVDPAGLTLELQPVRWALRLTEHPSASLSVLCVIRDASGRWLAGRRAAWLASWAGRWALGAGGAVEVDECPTEALRRELREEWAIEPAHLSVEALLRLPTDLVMLVAQARVPDGASVVPDHEHDRFAWWPAELERWPPEAEPALRRLGALLT